MSVQQQRLEEIKKIILEHKGRANPISANKIASMLNIPDNDTVSTTRALITKLILEEGLPIAASNEGYFYIETIQELNLYVEGLEQRIVQTTTRKIQIINNFHKTYGSLDERFVTTDDDCW